MATEEMQARLKEIATDMQRLEKVFHSTAIGEELQIISPMLNAMKVTSASLSLKPGIAPLFLSLCLSSSGSYAAESSLGFVGKDLAKGIDALTEALSPNGENRLLLKKIITALWIGAIASAQLIVKQGLGKNSKGNPEAYALSCELALTMIASSGVLQGTIKELLHACDAEHATDALALSTYVLIIKTMQEALKANLWETTEEYLLKTLQKIDSDNIALLQASRALEEGRSEELTDIFNNLVISLQINPEGLKKDLAAIGNLAENIYDSCTNLETAPSASINIVA